jgi:hypothetical protein
MTTRIVRLLGLAVLVALSVWLGRLVAHSKLPPPEGRWRELDDAALG